MHPLTYPTILTEIQDVLSDSDWDDPPSSRFWVDHNSQAESSARQSRSLKSTLHTFTQVCKQWRESTLARPSCWVTKLFINGYNDKEFKQSLSRAEKMLDGAQNSDIDFRAVVPDPRHFSPRAFQDFVGWMDRSIFSINDRVRKYEVGVEVKPNGANQPQILFDRFMDRPWPRLQVLRLYSFNGVNGMQVSGSLPAPKLHLAWFHGITWKDHPFPLPNNGVSVLDVGFTSNSSGPDPHSPDLSTLISASPPILLTSLSRLSLKLRNLQPPSEELPELPFFQLSSLRIYEGPPENAWTLLKSLRAPLLAELTVIASEKLGNIPAQPVQLDTLRNLRRLCLSMSACWFLPIFMALPAREKISTLIVSPVGEDEDINHRTIREAFFLSPMQFEGLQNLSCDYSRRADYDYSRGPDPWFLSTYDFSSARGHVQESNPEHLLLPPMSFVGEPGDLSEPKSGLSRFGHLNHVFFNVKILELEIDEYTVLTPGDLIPFSNVETLILTGFPEYREPDRRLFHWVSDEGPDGSSYLPQLSELVIKADIDAHRYKIVLEVTRDFLVRRQEQGTPIGIVALSSIPHSLRGDPVLEWFRQNQSFNLKLSTKYISKFDSSLPLDLFGC
jgi:hypothetical protein